MIALDYKPLQDYLYSRFFCLQIQAQFTVMRQGSLVAYSLCQNEVILNMNRTSGITTVFCLGGLSSVHQILQSLVYSLAFFLTPNSSPSRWKVQPGSSEGCCIGFKQLSE